MKLLHVVVILCVTYASCSDQVTLRIKQGKLTGKISKAGFTQRKYYSFKGIPYAEPPLGNLRFQPPKPHKGWENTLNAKKFGASCPQLLPKSEKDELIGEEDCLFLNVFTPYLKNELPGDEGLPIMVFIHGGLFRSESSSWATYGANNFMEEDVILVTINYRLGVLGFLDLEDPLVTGNMGLKDMIAALTWIQENIEQFGGDPKKVTIFGNGSGGVAVDLLLQSTASKGLFTRAICQSGVSLQGSYLDWGRKNRAIALAKTYHIDSSDAKSLANSFQTIDAYDFPINLTRVIGIYETVDKQIGLIPFSPSVDGEFVSKYPEAVFESGELPNPDVALMFGFNSQESILSSKYFVQRPAFITQMNRRFGFLFPLRGLHAEFDSMAYHEIAYLLKQFYFTNGTLSPDSLDEYLDFYSDLVVYPIHKTVKAYASSNRAPVYYYRFAYDGELNHFKNISTTSIFVEGGKVEVEGASEKDELCYLFRCGQIKPAYKALLSEGLKVVKRMLKLWTNFAKYGNPTPVDDTDKTLDGLIWEPVTKEKLNYLNIDEDLTMGENPHSKNIDFWDSVYEFYTPHATNGVLTNIKDEL